MNKYPIILNPETGEVDCLATQIAGQIIDQREIEREETEAMKRQHKEAVRILSKEVKDELDNYI